MRRARPSVEAGARAAVAALALIAAAVFGAAPAALAQSRDVPPPPRLDPAPLVFTITPKDLVDDGGDQNRAAVASRVAAAEAPARPPNAARLAPLPEQRPDDAVEEIIVLGGDWRLPDLGSRWRARQEAAEAEAKGRAHVTFLPLYDPEHPTTFNNVLLVNPEFARVGYIDLFRIRFGHRTKSDE